MIDDATAKAAQRKGRANADNVSSKAGDERLTRCNEELASSV